MKRAIHTVVPISSPILHGIGEAQSRRLLAKTFSAVAPHGTIAIAEGLTNRDHTGPINAAIFAVNMLIHSENGAAFSFEEISGWLSQAGFVGMRLLEAPSVSPLVLATRPDES